MAKHLYRGDCPDVLQPSSRDQECEACREEDELRKDAERYRTARCMTPHQWSAAWELNVATGKPFDEIIDNMRPFVGGR